MGKRAPTPLPTQFHGVSIAGGRLRYGDVDVPLAGVRVMVRDESTTTQEVTANGLLQTFLAFVTTDEYGDTDDLFRTTVPHGQVVLAVAAPGAAFEVPVDVRERVAAKEFAVAIRVAVKAAEAAG